MKKIKEFLVKHGINSTVLVIVFVLTIFVSNTISSYQTAKLLENNLSIETEEYQRDFMVHYYEVQSDWMNKWLAILGLLAAFTGIGVPLLLNASYKDKIEELQAKSKSSIDEINAKKQALKETIEEIKQDYNVKMAKFRQQMNDAVESAEINHLIAEIESLSHETIQYIKNREIGKLRKCHETIIKIAEPALTKYKDNSELKNKLLLELSSAYSLKGIIDQFDKNYNEAVINYQKSLEYQKNNTIINIKLLECYIYNNQIFKGLNIIKEISKINNDEFDEKTLNILKDSETDEAKELFAEIKKRIID